MSENRLIKKMSLYFIGNFSSRILSIFFIPIYAYYVSADDLGYFDYYQTISMILVPILFLAIWEAILKYVIQENNVDNKRVIVNTLNTFIISISFFSLLLFIVLRYFEIIPTTIPLAFSFMIVVQSITQIWQYYSRAMNENKLYVVSSIVGSITYLVLTLIYIVLLKSGLEGLINSYIISQLAIFIVIELKLKLLKHYRVKDYKFFILKDALEFSTPLVFNLISIWLISSANKLIVTSFLGPNINGLYSFANRFSIIITMFGTIVSMSLIEEAYSYKNIELYARNFSKIIQNLFRMYFSILIMAIPIIRLIYVAFANSDYVTSINYVSFLLLSSVLAATSNNFGSSFQVTNKTQFIFFTTLIGAIISISGSLILIDSIGIYGVLLSQVFGNIAMMATRAIYAFSSTGIKINWKPILIYLFCTVLVSVLININNNIVILFMLMVNFVIVLFLNKKEVKLLLGFFNSFRTK